MVSRREELMRDEFMEAIGEVAARYLKKGQMKDFWDDMNDRLSEGIVENNGDLFAQLSVCVINATNDRQELIEFTVEDMLVDYAMTLGRLDDNDRSSLDPEKYMELLAEAHVLPTRETCIDFLSKYMTRLQAYSVTLRFKWEEN